EALRLDSPRVWDSTAALELREVPPRLLVVGAGYIGLEMGSVYAALGSEVTVVEMTSGLLPGVDNDLVDARLHRSRPPDAHRRAVAVCGGRRGGRAEARPQVDARGVRRGGDDRRRAGGLRALGDPGGGVGSTGDASVAPRFRGGTAAVPEA